jgi:hypothetical protein
MVAPNINISIDSMSVSLSRNIKLKNPGLILGFDVAV